MSICQHNSEQSSYSKVKFIIGNATKDFDETLDLAAFETMYDIDEFTNKLGIYECVSKVCAYYDSTFSKEF